MTAIVNIPQGDLFSEHQLAALLSVSLRTVRRWHTERRGPRRVKIGRAVYYRRESVLEWVADREEAAE